MSRFFSSILCKLNFNHAYCCVSSLKVVHLLDACHSSTSHNSLRSPRALRAARLLFYMTFKNLVCEELQFSHPSSLNISPRRQQYLPREKKHTVPYFQCQECSGKYSSATGVTVCIYCTFILCCMLVKHGHTVGNTRLMFYCYL